MESTAVSLLRLGVNTIDGYAYSSASSIPLWQTALIYEEQRDNGILKLRVPKSELLLWHNYISLLTGATVTSYAAGFLNILTLWATSQCRQSSFSQLHILIPSSSVSTWTVDSISASANPSRWLSQFCFVSSVYQTCSFLMLSSLVHL
jgi:hypothetical protein